MVLKRNIKIRIPVFLAILAIGMLLCGCSTYTSAYQNTLMRSLNAPGAQNPSNNPNNSK